MSNGNDGKGDITTVEPEVSDEELEVAFKQIGNLKVGFDSMTQGQKLGVLQRLVTAVVKDEQYRQILLTAAFESKEEAMLASDAIAERKRYGVPIHPIVDRMLASLAFIGEGAVVALYYGNRLFQLPLALFGISMAITALPTMSTHFAENDTEKLNHL